MRGGVLPTGAAGIAPGLAGGGESLGLTLEEWNIALSRLERAARAVNADTQLLLTKGVPGSEVGVEADMKPAADSAAAAAAATAAGSADAGAEAAAKSNGAAVGSTTAGAPGKTGSTQARKGGAAAAAKNKRVECTGKVMVRRVPAKVEDVIETRIAVVGNGG